MKIRKIINDVRQALENKYSYLPDVIICDSQTHMMQILLKSENKPFNKKNLYKIKEKYKILAKEPEYSQSFKLDIKAPWKTYANKRLHYTILGMGTRPILMNRAGLRNQTSAFIAGVYLHEVGHYLFNKDKYSYEEEKQAETFARQQVKILMKKGIVNND